MKEAGARYARENGLMFIDEASSLIDKNIRETIDKLVEEINRRQCDLISKGIKKESTLKLAYEEEVRRDINRCCY